jgi:acetylornithine deacetylase/succinyl-diaminopimelate desuccinylase-like protein
MEPGALQRETTEVLARMVRANTVNPPGNERSLQEWLKGYLEDAGLQCELLARDNPERPNLVARLPGTQDGPVVGYLGHVDTVLADAGDWQHDPWSGDVHDGCLWGRGALDMKSQVAAEVVAAASLARSGWRPQRGELKLFSVVDEEVGGTEGAKWLTEERPDVAYADFILNEGGGAVMPFGDRRLYGVCTGEKGTFRFRVRARGRAGHASIPDMGDNALLKLVPALERLSRQPDYDLTPGPRALIEALGFPSDDPAEAVRRVREVDPRLALMVDPTLRVTFAPTRIFASEKINVIPAQADLLVDCRVPPGLDGSHAMRRVRETLGDDGGYEVEFTEQITGNESPVDSPLMDAIRDWIGTADPGGEVVPVVLPAFTDSRSWRAAFPDCVAYGFFPQRHQSYYDSWPLIHSADERVDVRDLGFATEFFVDVARRMLG